MNRRTFLMLPALVAAPAVAAIARHVPAVAPAASEPATVAYMRSLYGEYRNRSYTIVSRSGARLIRENISSDGRITGRLEIEMLKNINRLALDLRKLLPPS